MSALKSLIGNNVTSTRPYESNKMLISDSNPKKVIALAIKYRPDLPATSNRNLSSYPSPHSLSGPTRRAREHCPRDTFSDQSSSQEHDLNRPRRLRRKKADVLFMGCPASLLAFSTAILKIFVDSHLACLASPCPPSSPPLVNSSPSPVSAQQNEAVICRVRHDKLISGYCLELPMLRRTDGQMKIFPQPARQSHMSAQYFEKEAFTNQHSGRSALLLKSGPLDEAEASTSSPRDGIEKMLDPRYTSGKSFHSFMTLAHSR
ncbi:uncharacterized protein RCO7_10114 [Rhynchosporium graminicola]|uniref:Uncharacterized protein n=1 Tax=Rhynchosporium graminicola TaxID=2792576 RepID=A0A1E1K952_9HELO|nr:uncharacterized protein RCO7_10114 [Rhynchosporium commune]